MAILIIMIFSAAVYANTLKNGFVFDDEVTIVNNLFIKKINNLTRLFDKNYLISSNEMSYRPVVTFTYMVEHALYALKPWGYHLTNILLHMLNGILLYVFLSFLFQPSIVANHYAIVANIPLLLSLLFASHPVLTEAVNAVSFREDLLTFCFYIATMNLYLILTSSFEMKYQFHRHSTLFLISIYFISCLTFILALLSKEMAITLPLILFSYKLIYYKCETKQNLFSIWFDRYNTGYIIISIVYIYFRFSFFYNPHTADISSSGTIDRLLISPWLLIYYMKMVLFPLTLSADYSLGLAKYSLLDLLTGFFAVVSTLGIVLITKRNHIVFGLFFFVIALFPVYNIIPIPHTFAERYLYLPVVGLLIVAGSIIQLTFETRNMKSKTLNFYIISMFISVYAVHSFIAVNRNAIWKDGFLFWSDTVKKAPNSGRAHNNLGIAFYKMKRFDMAIREYQAALSLKPDSGDVHYNLGIVLHEEGKIDDAISEYQKALKLMPNNPDAYYNLGAAYTDQKRFDEAILQYRTGLKLRPDDYEFYAGLGFVYHNLGRRKEALHEYQIALRLNPDDAEVNYKLGVLYMEMGLRNMANMEFEKTLKLNPDHLQARKYYRTYKQ